jgi:hypothetical protein
MATTRRISDAAVRARTGRDWAEWLALLDADGVRGMSHPEIVRHIGERYGVQGWWAQSVTVEYEKARGLRDDHEKCTGYAVSASKTIAVPVADLYRAVVEDRERARWLPGVELSLRSATELKSARFEAAEGRVLVSFLAKGASKAQVVVQHEKLTDSAVAAQMKAFWRERLAALAAQLNTSAEAGSGATPE